MQLIGKRDIHPLGHANDLPVLYITGIPLLIPVVEPDQVFSFFRGAYPGNIGVFEQGRGRAVRDVDQVEVRAGIGAPGGFQLIGVVADRIAPVGIIFLRNLHNVVLVRGELPPGKGLLVFQVHHAQVGFFQVPVQVLQLLRLDVIVLVMPDIQLCHFRVKNGRILFRQNGSNPKKQPVPRFAEYKCPVLTDLPVLCQAFQVVVYQYFCLIMVLVVIQDADVILSLLRCVKAGIESQMAVVFTDHGKFHLLLQVNGVYAGKLSVFGSVHEQSGFQKAVL